MDYRSAHEQSLKHCDDEEMKKNLKSLNKDSRRHSVNICLHPHGTNSSVRVTYRWLNHKSSSCACEGDTKVVKHICDHGAHSVETIRGFIAIARYGPSSIIDLLGKELRSSGDVHLFPTPYCVKVLDM